MTFRSSPPITLKAQLLVWLAQPHQLRAFSRAIKAVIAVVALALSTSAGYTQGLTLDFASSPGDSVIFGGSNNTFQFSSTNGFQWVITGESGGSSAVGLFGSINNGPFHYGPITSSFGGVVQQASVLGPLGNLVINDGTGNLTGTVNWIDISTLFTAVGVFNAAVQLNVTGITYSGTNPDLQTLMANQPASLGLSFNFSPGMSLTDLSTGSGPYDTSYSGSISVVPEPASLTLSILGGFGLLYFSVRKSRKI